VEEEMHPEEVEERFASAGWDIDDGFSDYLVIGYSADSLSIIFRPEARHADEPIFELLDHVRDLTYWVREIPSPERAATLLQKHGRGPQEWD
jgi:hypothetical protein